MHTYRASKRRQSIPQPPQASDDHKSTDGESTPSQHSPSRLVVNLEFEKKQKFSESWFHREFDKIMQQHRRKVFRDESMRRCSMTLDSQTASELWSINEETVLASPSATQMASLPTVFLDPAEALVTRPLTGDITKRKLKTPLPEVLEAIYKPATSHPFLPVTRSSHSPTALTDSALAFAELFKPHMEQKQKHRVSLSSIRSEAKIAELVAKFTRYKAFAVPKREFAKKGKVQLTKKESRTSHKSITPTPALNLKQMAAPINTRLNQVILRGLTVNLKDKLCPYQELTHFKIDLPPKKAESSLRHFEYGCNRFGKFSFHWTKGATPSSFNLVKSMSMNHYFPVLPSIKNTTPVITSTKPVETKEHSKLRFEDIAKYWVLPKGMVLEDILPPRRGDGDISEDGMSSNSSKSRGPMSEIKEVLMEYSNQPTI